MEAIRPSEGDQPRPRPKHKRILQDVDTEAQADKAATVIVDPVEQELRSLTSHNSVVQHTSEKTEPSDQDVSDIAEHINAKRREMSREVTPPEQIFCCDQGERQDGDCGPAAIIGTLYCLY